MADLLALERALERLLALAPELSTDLVSLADAAGRWLTAPLVARLVHPPADQSAMDGWAIRFADRDKPWRIIGESAAGQPFAGRMGAGETVRIFTGAAVPEGADTIAVQEDVAHDGRTARLSGEGPPAAGAHIRRRGQDVPAGARLAEAGAAITPALVGLAAASGHGALPVRRRPRVALVATGNELVPAGALPTEGQIISSNGPMLAALLRAAGAEVSDLGIVGDDVAALSATFDAALGSFDVVVSIGGASVGDHDLVRPALERLGVAVDFWRVAIRPGKPLLAARRGESLLVGLPGNPVSAFVCAFLFLLPTLRHMLGCPEPQPRPILLPLAQPLRANGARRDFLRAQVANGRVRACPRQDSSLLSVLAAANALIIRPEHGGPVDAETSVPVLLFDDPATMGLTCSLEFP